MGGGQVPGAGLLEHRDGDEGPPQSEGAAMRFDPVGTAAPEPGAHPELEAEGAVDEVAGLDRGETKRQKAGKRRLGVPRCRRHRAQCDDPL